MTMVDVFFAVLLRICMRNERWRVEGSGGIARILCPIVLKSEPG